MQGFIILAITGTEKKNLKNITQHKILTKSMERDM